MPKTVVGPIGIVTITLRRIEQIAPYPPPGIPAHRFFFAEPVRGKNRFPNRISFQPGGQRSGHFYESTTTGFRGVDGQSDPIGGNVLGLQTFEFRLAQACEQRNGESWHTFRVKIFRCAQQLLAL